MRNLFDYTGKRVLMTGCYSGMGEAAAKIVRSLGGEVVAVDIKKPSFDYSEYLEVDLRDAHAIDEMVARVAKGGPIDRLFYCAGLPGTFPPVDVMLVNYVGLRRTVEQCMPRMPRGGAAVTISSAGGMAYQMVMAHVLPLLETEDPAAARAWIEKAVHEPWFECYTLSKACTILYTLRYGGQLTQKWGVRLNCISPGPTDTPMMPAFIEVAGADFMAKYPKPIGRNSTAEEQGWVLAFLNSDAASYVSGENVYTDGGTAGGIMTGGIAPPIPPNLG